MRAGSAVRESGALAPLEREALKARFNVRGTQPVDGMLVVGIDAKTFRTSEQRWPFARSLHARAVRRLHAAGAAHDRLRRPVHRAHEAARGPRALQRHRRTPAAPSSRPARATAGAARTFSAATATSARSTRARPPRTSATTRAARSPASRMTWPGSTASRSPPRSGSPDTHLTRPASATAPPGSTTAARPARSRPSRSRTWCNDRVPDALSPQPDRRCRGHGADAPRRALDARRRRGADAGRRGPGERDLDGPRRPPAALGRARRPTCSSSSCWRCCLRSHAGASRSGPSALSPSSPGAGFAGRRPARLRERHDRRRRGPAAGARPRRVRRDRLERVRGTPGAHTA